MHLKGGQNKCAKTKNEMRSITWWFRGFLEKRAFEVRAEMADESPGVGVKNHLAQPSKSKVLIKYLLNEQVNSLLSVQDKLGHFFSMYEMGI